MNNFFQHKNLILYIFINEYLHISLVQIHSENVLDEKRLPWNTYCMYIPPGSTYIHTVHKKEMSTMASVAIVFVVVLIS